jgi:hypothetical protein
MSSSSSSSKRDNNLIAWAQMPWFMQMMHSSLAFSKPLSSFIDKLYNGLALWLRANPDSPRGDIENIFWELENISRDEKAMYDNGNLKNYVLEACKYRFKIQPDPFSSNHFETNLFVLALLESCVEFAKRLLYWALESTYRTPTFIRETFITTNGRVCHGEFSPIMLAISHSDEYFSDKDSNQHLVDAPVLTKYLLMLDKMMPVSTFPHVVDQKGDNFLLACMKKESLCHLTKTVYLLTDKIGRQFTNASFGYTVASVAIYTDFKQFFTVYEHQYLVPPEKFADVLSYNFNSKKNLDFFPLEQTLAPVVLKETKKRQTPEEQDEPLKRFTQRPRTLTIRQ